MNQLHHWLPHRIMVRSWFWGLTALGGCGALGCLVAVLLLGSGTTAMPPLRVMTYNIEGGRTDRRQLLALMRQHNPDLVMLQEVARVRLASWFGERLQLPYQHFAAYPGTRKGGIALLSRWPLGPQRILHFRHSKQGKVALAAQVQTPAGSLWACSVHLDAPRKEDFGSHVLQQGAFAWGEFFMASVRYRQVQELRAWLTELADGAWIVAGDFNSMPFSSADRYFSRYFDDAFLQRPWRYFTGTFWDLPQVPVRPRIDYIYHSPRFWVRDAQVIQEKLSDHFPVLAVFAPITDLPAAVTSGTPAAQAHHPPP